jgi:hypothetical protein
MMRTFPPVVVRKVARVVTGAIMLAVVTVAGFIVPGIVWLPRAIRYEVSADSLRVMLRSGWWRTGREVHLSAITSARPVELGPGRRTMGSAMPGYCVGSYAFPGLGAVWLATSCGRAAVLVEAAGQPRPIVIAPADRGAFLTALFSRRAATFEPPPGAPIPGWTVVRVLAFLPVLLIPLLVATFFVAPGRLRYEIGQGELLVRTLIGTKRFPLAGTTVRRCSPGRVLKVAGNGLPGYYTGWFHLDGGSARVYATRLTDGVLLEGAWRVFVTPAEIEVFVEELKRNGGGTVSGVQAVPIRTAGRWRRRGSA